MLKVLELFSGIGCQTQALKNIGIEHQSTQCDIDKYAESIYNQIHGETINLGDINKVDVEHMIEGQWDLITYSSPCQDFSIAGQQAGGDKDSGTRSSLLWECEKIIKKVKPKYLLMENVKNLLSKKHIHNFEGWLKVLEDMGYTNYYKVLNAKDFGVPQNRERVFCVSILGEHKPYVFPEPRQLNIRLKDILEPIVDAKYYLSEKVQQRFKYKPQGQSIIGTTAPESRSIGQRDIVYNTENTMGALVATDYKQPKQIIEFDMPNGKKAEITNNVNEPNCFSELTNNQIAESLGIPLTKVEHWFRTDDCFAIPDAELWNQLKELLKIETTVFDESIMTFEEKDGVYEKANRCYDEEGLSPTLTATTSNEKIISNYKIRKLTPRECYRLMGWKDEQFDKIHGISDAQLYKTAGNGIVIPVLEAIFEKLLK